MEKPDQWTIIRVLDWTAERFASEGLESPRVDAEVLLAHCLDSQRIRLYMDHDKPLGASELGTFRAAVKRRLAGEPVAYITGHREFWSLDFEVDRAVLIPRPETELLVELASKLHAGSRPTMVDVGTGSGAVAIALARELPGATIYAVDCMPEALELARRNAASLDVELRLLCGDLLDPLPADLELDLVVSNPPYVTTAEYQELPAQIRDFEPRAALEGGSTGLEVITRLIPQASQRLGSGGSLMLEIGYQQGPRVCELMQQHGFQEVCIHQDLGGLNRVVTGRR